MKQTRKQRKPKTLPQPKTTVKAAAIKGAPDATKLLQAIDRSLNPKKKRLICICGDPGCTTGPMHYEED